MLAALRSRAHALNREHADPDQGHRRAADQHQVGRAPEGHVLAEEPVPDIVERKADQREGGASADQDAAERRVPVGPEPHRGFTRLAFGQDHGEEARREDAEEAGKDEVMGRVGERAGIAADVDVQRDVPIHAEERDQQRAGRNPNRDADPGRVTAAPLYLGGEAVQPDEAAGAVAEADVEQGGGEQHRRSRGDRDLAERRSRRRRCGGEERVMVPR